MTTGKFRDDMVERRLYEYRKGGSGADLMLEQSETNTRVNSAMVKLLILEEYTKRVWRGEYRFILEDIGELVQRLYLGLDGYARVQAIEMLKAQSVTGEVLREDRKRKGLLGILGG